MPKSTIDDLLSIYGQAMTLSRLHRTKLCNLLLKSVDQSAPPRPSRPKREKKGEEQAA